MGSHQQGVDSASKTGEHLISKVLDDPVVTQDDLRQLAESWDELCHQSVDKQDRLDAAHKEALDFEEGFADLIEWIDGTAEELAAQPEPSEDAAVLLQQIDENMVREICTYGGECLSVTFVCSCDLWTVPPLYCPCEHWTVPPLTFEPSSLL